MTPRRDASLGLIATAGLAVLSQRAAAQGPAPVDLPKPREEFGTSLSRALRQRRSERDFAPRPLPLPVLSELLWSACGVNRSATGDRTAPSWRHARETLIYAVMAEGAWLYDPIAHRLEPVVSGDLRGLTGTQDFPATAPLNVVYASDAAHLSGVSHEEQRRVAAADTGFIGQNVYLYCASEGLACVFRASLDAPKLAAALKLPDTRFINFAQTVGYPTR